MIAHRSPLYSLAVATSLLLGALSFRAGPARADDAYTVSGVAEDQAGASAQAAREAAQTDSRRKAFRQLIDRLAPSDGGAALTSLGDRDIAALVDSFQVDDERISAVRYLGVFTYRFRPASVQALLRGSAGAAGDAGRLVVEASLGSLEAWIAVRQRLAEIPRVAKTTIVSLRRDRAILALDVSGDAQAVIPDFARHDLTLARTGETWSLTPLRVPPAGAPPPPPAQ